jgi:hypothetical protein
VTLELPELGGFNFDGGMQVRNSFIALWLALSLYTSAFIAENVRGGILAISKGQTEASFALGLRPNRTMQLVILPQALRVIIPPLISQYPEPDEELLARHRRGLHGRAFHAGGHHDQPDGARARGDAASGHLLPDHEPDHLGLHELLQFQREAEGAVR